MTENRFPKLFLLAVFLFVFSSYTAYSQSSHYGDSFSLPYNSGLLEVYFDRADLESERLDWLRVAELGVDAVTADWENELALLMGMDAGFTSSKALEREDLERFLEERLYQWMIKRFFEDLTPLNFAGLRAKISSESSKYLQKPDYTTGTQNQGTGSLVLEEAKSPEEDRAEWKTAVSAAAAELLQEWEVLSLSVHSELLPLISSGREEVFLKACSSTFDLYKSGMKRELDKILTQEENRFITQRNGRWGYPGSTGKGETAGAVVSKLIQETEREVEGGIRRLVDGLDEHVGEVTPGAVNISADDWQESFKRELEKGLERWDRAERALLLERMEWERQAGKDFREGEAAWKEAYEELVDAREGWQEQVRVVFEEGQRRWDARERELSLSIEEARSQLIDTSVVKMLSLNARLDSLLSMGEQASGVIDSSLAYGEYWLEVLAGKDADLSVESFTGYDFEELQELLSQLPQDQANSGHEELKYWIDLWNLNSGYLDFADDAFASTYAMVMAGEEYQSPGSQFAVEDLYTGGRWENLFLDDCQVELVKAKALVEYWDEQVRIATALFEFVREERTGGSCDVHAAFEEELRNHESAKAGYDLCVSELNAAADAITEAQREMAAVQEELNGVGEELSAAREDYRTAISRLDEEEDIDSSLQALIDEIRSLEDEYALLGEDWQNAIDAFDTANNGYDACYKKAKVAFSDLEQAEFELAVANEIREYVALYNGEDGPPVSPADRLSFTQNEYERAREAFEAYEAFYSQGKERDLIDQDPLLKPAFDEYETSYREYLDFKRLTGTLLAAIERQRALVFEAENQAEDSLEAIIDPSKIRFISNTGDEGSEDGPRWQDFFHIEPSGDNLSRIAFEPKPGNLSEEYLDMASGFKEDRAIWEQEMSEALEEDRAAFEQMLHRWGLAYGYLMMTFSGNSAFENEEGKSIVDAAYSSGRSLLDENIAIALDNKSVKINYDAYITDAGKRALGDIESDPQEQKLFSFYVMSTLLGGVDYKADHNFLEHTSTFAVKDYVSKELGREIEDCSQQFTELMVLSAASFSAAVLVSFWPPAAIPFYVNAAIYFAAAMRWSAREEALTTIQGQLSRSMGAYASDIGSSKKELISHLQSHEHHMKELEEARAILALLEARDDPEGEITKKGFIKAFETALEMKEDAQNEDQEDVPYSEDVRIPELVSGIFDLLGEKEGSENLDIISMMFLCEEIARREKEGRLRYLELTTFIREEEHHQNLESYRRASEKDMLDMAETFFGSSAYSEKEILRRLYGLHHELRMDLQSEDLRSVDNRLLLHARNELLEEERQGLLALYEVRLNNNRAAREAEWSLMLESLVQERMQWQAKIETVTLRGDRAWKEALKKFEGRKRSWEESFEEQYRAKSRFWDSKYEGLREGKISWVDFAAAEAGSVGVIEQLGGMAERKIRETTSRIVTDMYLEPLDSRSLFAEFTNGFGLESLIENGKYLSANIAGSSRRLFARSVSDCFMEASLLSRIREFQARDRWEMERRAAALAAHSAIASLTEARGRMIEQVEDANNSFERSMNRMFVKAGFVESGGTYVRDAIVGSTLLGGVEQRRQVVDDYQFYRMPELDFGVDLDPANLSRMTGDGIISRVDLAMNNMQDQMEEVFGEPDESSDVIEKGWSWVEKKVRSVQKWVTEYVTNEETGQEEAVKRLKWVRETYEKTHKETDEVVLSPGEFGKWIGYAPKLGKYVDPGKSIKANLAYEGTGELGRLIKAFLACELEEGKGWEEFNLAFYDKKLWIDNGAWLKAPTLRSVANVGVAVAATALTGNPLLAMALNMADDAAFTMMDIGSSRLSWDEGLVNMGKQALTSAIGTGFSGLGNMVQFAEDFGGVLGKTIWEGQRAFFQNVSTGLVNSVTYQRGGIWDFNTLMMEDIMMGRRALAGYAGGMAGTFVSEGLGALNNRDIRMAGFSDINRGHVKAFNELAGGFSSSALEYAIAGETTLNILNFRDVAKLLDLDWYRNQNGAWKSNGLWEMNLGGDTGFSMGLGMGGMDVSVSKMADALGAFKVWSENRKIDDWSERSGIDGNIMMRSLYSYSDNDGMVTYRRLLDEIDKLMIGLERGEAKTVLREDGGKDIRLAALGGDLNSQLYASVLMQHEAHRDGLVTADNYLETREAVAARAEMLLAMDKDYEGLIYSDARNLMDVMMHEAGEETFDAYVDEFWNSDEDWAERVINRKKIGVRRTNFYDQMKYTPGLAATFRWAKAKLGGDVYKDHLLPESEMDSQNRILQELAETDAFETELTAIGATAGAASWAINGGNLGKALVGLNPLDSPDVLGAVSALLNDRTIAKGILDALKFSNKDVRPYSSDDITHAYRQMTRGILQADSLSEMEWYTRATAVIVDHYIFDMAGRAGIPLEVDNQWHGNEYAEAQVANQMMRNYMFVGEMFFNGITKPELIRKMYYEGFAKPLDLGRGLRLWDNVAGFAEQNCGPWDDWTEETAYESMQQQIKKMNSYNMTNFALTTTNIKLYESLTQQTTEIYDDWFENNRYDKANQNFWADYHHYYINVYLRLIGN